MKKLFALADRDGDGKLSKEEWFRVLQRSGVPVTRSVSTRNSKFLLSTLHSNTYTYVQIDHMIIDHVKSGIKLIISSPLWIGTLTGG